MKHVLLALRINRRAIAAAVLADEALTLAEGRHLSSRSDRTVVAAAKYLSWLLDITKPDALVVDAPPRIDGKTTGRVLQNLQTLASERGIPLLPVSKPEILAAYGHPGLRDREELRETVRTFWPELANIRGKVEPFVADAAAAALYADTRLELERVPG